jgi:predicted glycosyltransferase
MKGLFYCQYLKGLGHLRRSLILCNTLYKKFEILFIQGGKSFENKFGSQSLPIIYLPPLSENIPTGLLFDPQMETPVEKIFQTRLEIIKQNLNNEFAFFITEFFPFGIIRPEFHSEIKTILEILKKQKPSCIIMCSLRDVMTQMNEDRQKMIVDYLEEYYDYVLVHSDPNIFTLEDSWESAAKISNKIIYTGYIADSAQIPQNQQRKKEIIISLGGGSVGEKLAFSVIKVASYFPEYVFKITVGPECSRENLRTLERNSNFLFNVQVMPFIKEFEIALSQCALSISLGGYNTIVSLLKTETPAIIFPYDFNREQKLRVDKFAELDLLKVIDENNLKPNKLRLIIKDQLKKPYPKHIINLNGAETSLKFIEKVISTSKTDRGSK